MVNHEGLDGTLDGVQFQAELLLDHIQKRGAGIGIVVAGERSEAEIKVAVCSRARLGFGGAAAGDGMKPHVCSNK